MKSPSVFYNLDLKFFFKQTVTTKRKAIFYEDRRIRGN